MPYSGRFRSGVHSDQTSGAQFCKKAPVFWAVRLRTVLLEHVVSSRKGCREPRDHVQAPEVLVGFGVQQFAGGDGQKRQFGVLCAQGRADQFYMGSLGSF